MFLWYVDRNWNNQFVRCGSNFSCKHWCNNVAQPTPVCCGMPCFIHFLAFSAALTLVTRSSVLLVTLVCCHKWHCWFPTCFALCTLFIMLQCLSNFRIAWCKRCILNNIWGIMQWKNVLLTMNLRHVCVDCLLYVW